MRKQQTVILVFLLALCYLLSASASAKTTITIWHGFPDRPPFQAFVDLIGDFNDSHTDIEVKLIGKSVRPDSVIAAVAGGVAPDVLVSTYSYTPQYAAKDFLLDLTAYAQRDSFLSDFNSDFIPGSLPAVTWDGKIWGVPTDVNVFTPMYVTTTLDSAGVQHPDVGWTWNDLVGLTRKVRRVESDGSFSVYPIVDEHPLTAGLPFLLQAGARFWDDHGRKSLVDTQEMRKGLNFLEQLYDEQYMVPLKSSDSRPALFAGKAAFLLGSSESLGRFLGENPNIRVSPALRAPNGDPTTAMNFYNLAAIKSGDASREAASWELIKFLTRPQSLTHIAVLSNTIPARLSSIRSDEYLKTLSANPAMRTAATEVAPFGTTRGWADIPAFGSWLGPDLMPLLSQLRPGDNRISVEQFIETLDQKTQTRLDDMQK